MTKQRDELTRDEMNRQDDVDNAIFDMLNTLAERELEWDIKQLSEVREFVNDKLGIPVRYPALDDDPTLLDTEVKVFTAKEAQKVKKAMYRMATELEEQYRFFSSNGVPDRLEGLRRSYEIALGIMDRRTK